MRMSLDAWHIPVTSESRTGAPMPAVAVPGDASASATSAATAAAAGKPCNTSNLQDDAASFRFLVEVAPGKGEGDEAEILECTYSYTVQTSLCCFFAIKCCCKGLLLLVRPSEFHVWHPAPIQRAGHARAIVWFCSAGW